jgi:hypothetical protein
VTEFAQARPGVAWYSQRARSEEDHRTLKSGGRSEALQLLQEHEWPALYCTVHQTPHPPEKPPTFREAVRWIAPLGGFLARKGDGEPGGQTLWRDLQRLNDIARTWKLLKTQRTYG